MAGIDDVLERLVVDDGFRAALARDPHAALVEYDLAPAEVALLASRLDDGDQAQRAVEQRTSKSALLAALGMLGGGGEAAGGIGGDQTLTVGGDQTLTVGGDETLTVGGDETLTVRGNRTEGPTDEYTKVPAPPAPPVPIPYPNTAEGEVTIESLELATEGIDVDDTDAAAVGGPRKYGDITLKRGLTDDSGAAHGDDLAVPDGDVGDGPSGQPGVGEPEPEPDALGQTTEQGGDGQADVVTAAGPGARPLTPQQDDDVLEISDADEDGARGS